MTQAPTPGPLTSESVKLLVKGDLLRVICDTLIGEPSLRIPNGTVVEFEAYEHGLVGVQGDFWGHSAFAFIGRPDADGWMPWSGNHFGENPVPGQMVLARTRMAKTPEPVKSEWIDWSSVIAFRLAPTAPVEASGSEREAVVSRECKQCGAFKSDLSAACTFCGSTTPARAEAQDEGAAGVAVAWDYCPECGSREICHEEGDHKQCGHCGQEWFSDIDYSGVVQNNLARLYAHPSPTPAADADRVRKFSLGDRVEKTKGSAWHGRVVGFYSTSLTQVGYAVESEREPGSVQIYPEAALKSEGK